MSEAEIIRLAAAVFLSSLATYTRQALSYSRRQAIQNVQFVNGLTLINTRLDSIERRMNARRAEYRDD